MPNIIGVGQLSLTDLNDAIISGTPPVNPSDGTLWIDSSKTPNLLKKWSVSIDDWIIIGEISTEGTSETVESITETLGNMANDNKLDVIERQIIKDKLTEIIGYVIADTATTLPTTATLDSSKKGGFYTVRQSALNAGIPSTDAKYVAVANAWDKASTGLKQYLEGMTPVKPWDIRDETKIIDVVKATFRDKWLQYYIAVNDLAIATTEKLNQKIEDIEVGGRNFGSNGDFSIPLNEARWKDGYTGQTINVVDISSETPPFQFALYVKNTTNANGGIFYGEMFLGSVANALVGKDLTVQFWLKYQNIVQGTNTFNKGQFGTLVVEGETSTGTKVYSYPSVLTDIVGTNMTWAKYSQTFRIALPPSAVKLTKISLKHGMEGAKGEFWTTGIKVEGGNKVTDWTEDPLDMQGRIYNVEQKILPDKIVDTVRSSEKYLKDLTDIENKVAKLLTLDSTANIMSYDAFNNANPSTQMITFTAKPQNLTGTVAFTATPYDSSGNAMTAITLGGSGNVRTLTASQFGTTAVRVVVTASLSGYSDTITIVKIKDGAKGDEGQTGASGKDVIAGFLTNESMTLSANENGVIDDLSVAKGTFEVYDGLTKKTGTGVTYAVANQTGCTVSITTAGVYSVTSMSADTATATLTAVYNGVTITKVLSLSKSRKGATGSAGKGVSSSTVTYQNHTSGTTAPTGTWSSTVPTPVKGQYLWTRTVTTYTDNSTVTTYSVAYNATDGQRGNDGKGISSTAITYQLHTNGTTAPTGTWVTSPPAPVKGQYLWTRTIITYTDSTTSTSYSTSYFATDGQRGNDGISVSSIIQEYYLSTSATTQTGGSWVTSPPAWADGKYMWIRTKTTFSDSTTSTTTAVNVTGQKGSDGTTTYTWVRYADDANGAGISASPSGKRFMGIAPNKTSSTPSNTASDYTWSPLYDNVRIGGRNLYLDSFLRSAVSNSTTTGTIDITDGTPTNLVKMTYKSGTSFGFLNGLNYRTMSYSQNESYMLSFDVRGNVTNLKYTYIMRVDGTNTAMSKSPSGLTLSDTDWTRIEIPFTAPWTTEQGYILIGSNDALAGKWFEVRNIMVEKGNVATEWTPAPEDLQEQINNKADSSVVETLTSEYNSALIREANNINASVEQKIKDSEGKMTEAYKTEVETRIGSFNVEFTTIKQDISDLNGGMSEVKSYFNFKPEGLTIGKTNSPFQVSIDNESLQFINNGGGTNLPNFVPKTNAVAWINGKMMYIDGLEVLSSLIVGNHRVEKYSSEITIVKYSGQ